MDDHGKVEELRREIALIQGWNDRYLLAQYPTNAARKANEQRPAASCPNHVRAENVSERGI